jgi:hypothetical protein
VHVFCRVTELNYGGINSIAVLPTRRKFGRRTQKQRPSKKVSGPKNLMPNWTQMSHENAEKGPNFSKGLCPVRFPYELMGF